MVIEFCFLYAVARGDKFFEPVDIALVIRGSSCAMNNLEMWSECDGTNKIEGR